VLADHFIAAFTLFCFGRAQVAIFVVVGLAVGTTDPSSLCLLRGIPSCVAE